MVRFRKTSGRVRDHWDDNTDKRPVSVAVSVMDRSHIRCAACCCAALVETLLVFLLVQRSNAQHSVCVNSTTEIH